MFENRHPCKLKDKQKKITQQYKFQMTGLDAQLYTFCQWKNKAILQGIVKEKYAVYENNL